MENDQARGSLHGAFSGLPGGLVVGGCAGSIGGLFGKSKQKKELEQLERAQAASRWDPSDTAALDYLRAATAHCASSDPIFAVIDDITGR